MRRSPGSNPRYLIEGIDGEGRYRRVRTPMPAPPEWKRIISVLTLTGTLPRRRVVWRQPLPSDRDFRRPSGVTNAIIRHDAPIIS